MFADITNDNLVDLYITMLSQIPMPDLFFRNMGDHIFQNEGKSRGIDDFDGGSHGSCWADLDNDGDYDLFNSTSWDHPDCPNCNNIYKNIGGGYFENVTPPVLKRRTEKTRAVNCFDMDNDGDLDLYCITGYLGTSDPPNQYNEVYINEGDFRFKAVQVGDLYSCPAGQGAIDTDFDGDGDIDIIAANRTGDVNILRNDGKGHFNLVLPESIGIQHQAQDGITTADIDNDGDLDILLAMDNVGVLYVNLGNDRYRHTQSFYNVDGYMGGFADLDNDGDLDLVFAGNNTAYLNDGKGYFSDGPELPVEGISDPRSVAFADIDNDGDLDFAFGARASRNWLICNDYKGKNHWLKVRLISPQGQAGAFGAKVFIYSNGEKEAKLLCMREAKSNYGYLGQDDPVLHFGLGEHCKVNLKVCFLDGTLVELDNFDVDRIVSINGSEID